MFQILVHDLTPDARIDKRHNHLGEADTLGEAQELVEKLRQAPGRAAPAPLRWQPDEVGYRAYPFPDETTGYYQIVLC